MSNQIKALVVELKQGLEKLYGPRLKNVYLYGSYARGQTHAESDVDILVVLDEVPHYAAEINYTGDLKSALSLQYDLSISTVFLAEADWLRGESPFLWNIRKDAIAA